MLVWKLINFINDLALLNFNKIPNNYYEYLQVEIYSCWNEVILSGGLYCKLFHNITFCLQLFHNIKWTPSLFLCISVLETSFMIGNFLVVEMEIDQQYNTYNTYYLFFIFYCRNLFLLVILTEVSQVNKWGNKCFDTWKLK